MHKSTKVFVVLIANMVPANHYIVDDIRRTFCNDDNVDNGGVMEIKHPGPLLAFEVSFHPLPIDSS